MTQARIANEVKQRLQIGAITRAEAIKTLRERTTYGTAMVLAMVREWEQGARGDVP